MSSSLPEAWREPLPPVIADPDKTKPAEGLRSSTSCAVRRIREFVDSNLYNPFPGGVSLLGHNAARDFIEYVLKPVSESVVAEFEIPWEFGISHIDAVVTGEGPYPGCYEIKSSSKEDPSPSGENTAQVKRMIVLAERAGITLPQPFQIVCICKTHYRIHGPFPVTLSDIERVQINHEFDATCRLMERIEQVELHNPEWFAPLACTCSACFPKPVATATWDMELIDAEYLEADDKQRTAIRKRMKPLIEAAGVDRVYEAQAHVWQVTKAGHVRATVRRSQGVTAA